MKIVIVSDAWEPQVNGVVRTLRSVKSEIEAMGHCVALITPDRFRSLPCPTYPEIRLALTAPDTIGRLIEAEQADALHISTEGPLGLAARRWCVRNGLAFTTAYHTQFPDYIQSRSGIPARWTWRFIRWFHAPSAAVLTSTPTIRHELEAHGITHVRHWGRGVDLDCFHPDHAAPAAFANLPRPVQLMLDAWRWRRISRRFWPPTIPERAWLWGTDRRWKTSSGDFPTRCSWARFRAAR